MKKIIQIVYPFFLIFGILLIVFGFKMSENVSETNHSDTMINIIKPNKIKIISENERSFSLDIGDLNDGSYSLVFYTRHQFVEVRADGKLLYSLKSGNKSFGDTTGSVWNFIGIPNYAQTIEVRLTAAYPMVRDNVTKFYTGEDLEICKQLLEKSLVYMAISIVIAVIGILLLLYWIAVSRKTCIGNSALYFSVLAILLGIWSYGETDIATLTIQNRTVASFMAYILLMLIPIPFVLFIKEFLNSKIDFLWKTLYIISLLDFAVCTILQLTQIRDFRETIIVTHSIFILSLLYMFISIGERVYRRTIDRFVRVNIIGMIALIFAVVMDLVGYYSRRQDIDVAGRVGFLAYIILIGIEVTSDSLSKMEEGKKAGFYRELSIRDQLTGTFNRNAYVDSLKEIKNPANIMIVICDLNNLKKCNDHMGHQMGDKYIIDAANILNHIFEKYGSCYRIGGDEFCIIISQVQKRKIEKLIVKLEKSEFQYNKVSKDVYMQIACGYAEYDNQRDQSIEDTCVRADTNMYINKKMLKEKMK